MDDHSGLVAAVVGGGIVGSQVAYSLNQEGWRVIVVEPRPEISLAVRILGSRVEQRCGDVLDTKSLTAALAGVDVVVHAATFPRSPVENPRLNHTFDSYVVRGAAAIAGAAQRRGCRRIVLVSAAGRTRAGTVGTHSYLHDFARGESVLLGSPIPAVCLRCTAVYGPGDRGFTHLAAAARTSVVPVIGSGQQLCQPVYSADVGHVAATLCDPAAPVGVVEIGGPDRMTFNAALRTALSLVPGPRQARLVHVPAPLARLAARAVAAFVPGSPRMHDAVAFATSDDLADLSRLSGLIDRPLTELADGLRRSVASHRRLAIGAA